MNHSTEAGDAPMTQPTLDALYARLEDLRRERFYKEMSDDFAYTNGSIGRIDARIADVQREIARRQGVTPPIA